MKTLAKPFSVEGSRALAREILGKPPEKTYIERVEPVGDLVREFFLPLELCKPFNRVGRAGAAAQGRMLGGLKKKAYELMRLQNGGRDAKEPLTGRPHIICVRFASVPSDVDSGWSKNPIDRLRVGHNGLGIVVQDSRAHVRTSLWWEPCPPKKGFVYIAVHRGEETATC